MSRCTTQVRHAGHAAQTAGFPEQSRGGHHWLFSSQALTLAPSWSPPHAEVTWRGPRRPSRSEAKRRGLRAALGPQPTPPSGLRFRSPSPKTWKLQQPETLGALAKGSRAPGVPAVPSLHGKPSSNASSGTGVQEPTGKGNPRGCACPTQASLAPRAAAPPRAAQVPTPRTEEAAWAAMALTFLLVLLTLATLCTRLHRNFRRGESIYWGPAADSQDTVAGEKPLLAQPLPSLSPCGGHGPGHDRSPSCPCSGAEAEATDAPAPEQALTTETFTPAHTGQRPGWGQL